MITRIALLILAGLMVAGCSKESPPPPVAPPLPPEVLALHPPARTIGAAYDTEVWVTFESPLDPTTVNERTVFLKLDTRRITSVITTEDGGRRIRLLPQEELLLRRTYTVEITGNVQTLEGGSFGTTFFWQFTTNSLRRLEQPSPAAGATDEPPAAALAWRPNDEAAGPVTYRIYSGLDSAAVAARAVTARVSKNAWVLTTEEWPSGSRVFWTVDAANDETGEEEAAPVWAFNVIGPGAAIDSLTIQAFDIGYFSRRTGRWVCGSLITGSDAAVTIARFQLGSPLLSSLKLESVTMTFSPATFLTTDPGLVISSMNADNGCGSASLPSAVEALAIATLQENRIYGRSVLLTSQIQTRIRGVAPLHGYLLNTSRTVNYAASSMTLRYYRLPQ